MVLLQAMHGIPYDSSLSTTLRYSQSLLYLMIRQTGEHLNLSSFPKNEKVYQAERKPEWRL